MKPKLFSILLSGLSLLSAGCATQLNAKGAAVRVTSNPEVVRGCKYLGRVSGSDHMHGGVLQGTAEKSADAEMRNGAAWIGANTIFLVRGSTGWGGSSQMGEAYSCPAAPATAAR